MNQLCGAASAQSTIMSHGTSSQSQHSRSKTEEAASGREQPWKPGSWGKLLACRCIDTGGNKVHPSSAGLALPYVANPDKSGLAGLSNSRFSGDGNISPYVTSSTSSSRSVQKTIVGAGILKCSSTPAHEHHDANKTLLPLKQDDKPCLVLDLDETLIHSTFEDQGKHDFTVIISIWGVKVDVYVKRRPFLDEFLESMSNLFEIGVFTASLPEYAAKVIQHIDPKSYIQWALYRDSCSIHKGRTVKDLHLLPRELNRTVIVDDRPTSYMLQPSNGINCVPFQDNPKDTELLSLQETLYRLSQVEGDLRIAVREHQKLGSSELDSTESNDS